MSSVSEPATEINIENNKNDGNKQELIAGKFSVRSFLKKLFISIAFLTGAWSCSKAQNAGLEGRWSGTIVCANETSDVEMLLELQGTKIVGEGTTRRRGVTTSWQISGSAETVTRERECVNDQCVSDDECVGRGAKDETTGERANTTCNEQGRCTPCVEEYQLDVVTVTLGDLNSELADPVLTLERLGENQMTGGISAYCQNETVRKPTVDLNKQQP